MRRWLLTSDDVFHRSRITLVRPLYGRDMVGRLLEVTNVPSFEPPDHHLVLAVKTMTDTPESYGRDDSRLLTVLHPDGRTRVFFLNSIGWADLKFLSYADVGSIRLSFV